MLQGSFGLMYSSHLRTETLPQLQLAEGPGLWAKHTPRGHRCGAAPSGQGGLQLPAQHRLEAAPSCPEELPASCIWSR